MPRHSPYALSSLTKIYKNGRYSIVTIVYIRFLLHLPNNIQFSKNTVTVVTLKCLSETSLSGWCTRKLVGGPGFEPGTSSLSGMRSNQLSYTPKFDSVKTGIQNGGGKRVRTDDLLNANQALSQLSYTPVEYYCLAE